MSSFFAGPCASSTQGRPSGTSRRCKLTHTVVQEQNGLVTPATGSSASFLTPSQMGSPTQDARGSMPPPVQRGGVAGRGAMGFGTLPSGAGTDRGRGGFPVGMGG